MPKLRICMRAVQNKIALDEIRTWRGMRAQAWYPDRSTMMDMPPNSSTERAQRWLFVCAGGIDRSPIAAAAARAMAVERGRKLEATHLGLFDFLTTNFLEADFFAKFDRIFVMEKHLGDELREKWGYRGEMVCLEVQDTIVCNSLEDAQALDRIMRARLDQWM